jgi:hypothetical protein
MTTETTFVDTWVDTWRKDKSRGVRGGTIPKMIPPGRKLMHNQVRHYVDSRCGANGFRAWTADRVPEGFVKCPCGWAGLPHYGWKECVERLKATTK